MNYRKIIISIMTVLLFSCNNNDKIINEVKELSHRKITFCDGYKELPCNSKLSLGNLIKQDIKIITYMDNISCTSCGIKTLKLWQKEIKELNKDVAYIIILHSDYDDKIFEMTKRLSLDFPLMYYDSKVFEERNGLKGILACNKTFLLNKNNEIILVGEPFGREKLTNLYRKHINSLNMTYYDNLISSTCNILKQKSSDENNKVSFGNMPLSCFVRYGKESNRFVRH